MRTSDFDYQLPENLIAQVPLGCRDTSRLLILDSKTGQIEHATFKDLPSYLSSDDLIVVNDSRVIPARIFANPLGSCSKVELLLLRREEPFIWQAIGRPGRQLKLRKTFKVMNAEVHFEVIEIRNDNTRLVKFSSEQGMDIWGHVPLPPYIRQKLSDKERYQTVYSSQLGSAAAPTAGLHFTTELLNRLGAKGVNVANITLHVGLDTFQPVHAEDPLDHKIHKEYFSLSRETADIVNATKANGSRVIAIGTTVVRSLEQAALWGMGTGSKLLNPTSGWADIFILPGHDFKLVEGMVTNFHFPRSSVLMLVSALAGHAKLKRAYDEAIKNSYRFYSFGDAMLIL